MPRSLGLSSGSGAPATGGDWPSWLTVLGAAVASAWLASLLVLLCGKRSAKKPDVDDVQKKQAKQAKVKSASAKAAAASSSKTPTRSSGAGIDAFPVVDIMAGPHPAGGGGGACCCSGGGCGGGGGGCGGCACGVGGCATC